MQRMNYHLCQPKAKIATKKKQSQNNFFFCKKLLMNDTSFGNKILIFLKKTIPLKLIRNLFFGKVFPHLF